jgi:hypothetical protein
MSITMILRRPILLRWTSFMDESVQVLEKDGFDSDKILVQHVKMAHIGEKISHEFCLDDPCSQVGFNDPKVSYLVKVFENDLQKIKDQDALLPKDRKLPLRPPVIPPCTDNRFSRAYARGACHRLVYPRNCHQPEPESGGIQTAFFS